MISISTGSLPNADDLGLVEQHAYAVLELKEVDGKKFILVLNPWGRFYWKGEYSVDDTSSWTPKLKKELGYDILKSKDKGIFWIEFETAAKVFEILECNWNPDMLSYSLTKFGLWKSGDMVEGFEDISLTPQYTLRFSPNQDDIIDPTHLWVVLSKLVLDEEEDFSETKERDPSYISVHVLENKHKGGVLHSMKNIIKKNVFTSELTYTFRITIPQDMLKKIFSLIIAQDSFKKDLYYSIKVFSNVNFVLNPAQCYENVYEIPIDQGFGGGTPNHDTFYMNPQIYFKAKKQSLKSFNCWLSYKIHGFETAVKIFLVRSDEPQRIEYLTTSNIVGKDDSPYYNKSWAQHFILQRDESYIAVVSTFNMDDPITGVFTIKSNAKVDFELIDPL